MSGPLMLNEDGWFYTEHDSAEGALIGGRLVGDTFTDNGSTAWNGWFAPARIGRKTTYTKHDIRRWKEIASCWGASVSDDMIITMNRDDGVSLECDMQSFARVLILIDSYNQGIVK